MEDTPKRPSIVPTWARYAAGGVVLAIVLVAVIVVIVARTSQVRVPDLTGSDSKAAKSQLAELGLQLQVSDRLFSSTVPLDGVISQKPKAGSMVSRGSTIDVSVSGGSESFAMPDVVGMTTADAQKALSDRGLKVTVETAASDKPAGTIIASFPSAGITVSTSDPVRITAAAGQGSTSLLLPTNLSNLTFVLDPAPVAGVAQDVTMDVSRRVQALLEASGATVVETRSANDAAAAVTTMSRLTAAKSVSAIALVGLSVAPSGPGGTVVVSVPATTTTQPFYIRSTELATQVSNQLKQSLTGVRNTTADNDAILMNSGTAAVRVQLGSATDGNDKVTFADPDWADKVARAIYKALGQLYGQK
jgi:N-acetylmuramoyl-L-alanine amidase